MHQRTVLLAAGILACSTFASAEPPDSLPPDTLQRPSTMDEIVVTATKMKALLECVPSSVNVIPNSLIENKPGSLLADALAGVPGLAIRSNGSGASLQTISLRGMSPEHTLVLIDGQRINSAQSGLVDFGVLSSSDIERVEVVKGGYSALYGADAIGGVVNIITKRPPETLSAEASTSLGSYGYSSQMLSAGSAVGTVGFRGLIQRERSNADYKFQWATDGGTEEMRRSGEDFNVLTADAHVQFDPSPAVTSFLAATYTDAERGSPGEFSPFMPQGLARLADRFVVVRGGSEWAVGEGMTLSLGASGQNARETYTDPGTMVNGLPSQSIYTNRAFVLSPGTKFWISPLLAGSAGIEYGEAGIDGSDLNNARRVQRSVFAATQHTVALPWTIPFEFILYPSLRYDDFSDFKSDVSPRLGVNVGLVKEPVLRVRASYGKSFHAPVFNDLYWKYGGNPNLRPERSTSFDAGCTAELNAGGRLRLDASYFSIDAKDRIVWTPGSDGLWSPMNISSAKSHGIEGEAQWTGIGGLLTLTANTTWTVAKKTSADYPGDPTADKYLVYVPEHVTYAMASVAVGNGNVILQQSWSGKRFTSSDNATSLPGYSITSAAVRYPLPLAGWRLSLKGEVSNIFNTSYQVIDGYPMPFREFRGTLGVIL